MRSVDADEAELAAVARVLLAQHGDDRAKRRMLARMPNLVGETPLLAASKRGAVVLVQLLLEAGADVHAVDQDGHSALHHVC